MIKFRTQGSSGAMVGIGLNAENVRMLEAGHPMVIALDDETLVLFARETDAELQADVEKLIQKTVTH